MVSLSALEIGTGGLDGRAAAVHRQDRTGDVPRSQRGQEGDRIGDLVGLRRALQQRCGTEGCGTSGVGAAGEDRAGGDGVDVHSVGAVFRRPGSGESRESRLGRAIGSASGQADLPGHAPHVDHTSVAARSHARCQPGHQVEGGADVAGDERIESGGVQVRGLAEPGESAVVDQDIHVTGLVGEAIDFRQVVQGRRDEPCAPAVPLDLLDGRGSPGRVTAVDDHEVTVLGQPHSGSPADAGGRSGHQSDLRMNVQVEMFADHDGSLLRASQTCLSDHTQTLNRPVYLCQMLVRSGWPPAGMVLGLSVVGRAAVEVGVPSHKGFRFPAEADPVRAAVGRQPHTGGALAQLTQYSDTGSAYALLQATWPQGPARSSRPLQKYR